MGDPGGGSEQSEAQAEAQAQARRWSFGSAAFDERAMQLFVGGRAVELELKPLEVLRYLLQRPAEAVSKDDLIKAVWPGRIISDSALTSTIAKLREALGAEEGAIRTVHGFGYRFDAEVRAGAPGGPAEPGPAPPSRAPRRLTAIMFTDLVGYSALAHDDEALAIELLELHRVWVREILPGHGGREVETIGDAFLIEFGGALAAVECAVAIQRRFAGHNAAAPEGRRMQLRIGIHAGDVEHKDGKVMGDGVNIASRIHGLAEPGGICVSDDVHRAVRSRGFRFESIGTPALKNIATPLELYRVRLDGAPSPAPAARRRWMGAPPRWLAAVAAMVLAAGLAVAGYLSRAPRGEAPPPSVAVLPFENLSPDADDEYFVNGLHDSVIGHLARIQGIKVISRTSVMRFRGKRESLKAIAKELGVAHILEGSVQRAGNKLRVVAQLIDAQSDTHLWSNEYDRELADVFAVQADIAGQVAGAVQVKLTPGEQASIAAIPTRSQDAYDFYLRALPQAYVVRPGEANVRKALAWLDEALELDPDFALAYALRSRLHDTLDWWGFERSAWRREQGRRDAEKALSLTPDLAEAHLVQAIQFYHGSYDYTGAIRELEIARRLAPGNASVDFWLGVIYRRMGRWDDSVASLERVATLDPLNAPLLSDHAFTLMAMRRYAEARKVYDRIMTLDPTSGLQFFRAYARFVQSGDAEELARTLSQLPRETESDCHTMSFLSAALSASGRHDEAIAAMQECKYPSFVHYYYNERLPAAHFIALARWYKDRTRAPPEAATARAMMEQELITNPKQSHLRMFLAMSLVMSGERTRALEETERALKDIQGSRDAWSATILLQQAAEVYANTGQVDRAFAELEESLARPGGIHVAEIRTNPAYAVLRSDPRYQKLIAARMPKE